jgi:hypothetical protein
MEEDKEEFDIDDPGYWNINGNMPINGAYVEHLKNQNFSHMQQTKPVLQIMVFGKHIAKMDEHFMQAALIISPKFNVLKVLGSGSYSIVYLVENAITKE